MGAIYGSQQQVGRCSARSSSIAQAWHPVHGRSRNTIGITGPGQQERASALGGQRRDQIIVPHFSLAMPHGRSTLLEPLRQPNEHSRRKPLWPSPLLQLGQRPPEAGCGALPFRPQGWPTVAEWHSIVIQLQRSAEFHCSHLPHSITSDKKTQLHPFIFLST
jgi:hypothetical protein